MKYVWEIDRENPFQDIDIYNEDDAEALKIILWTIKEADSNLVLKNETTGKMLSISLKDESIVIVESDNTAETDVAMWVPYITYAIGAMHEFLSSNEQKYLLKGKGHTMMEHRTQNIKAREIDDCMKWLVYEHRACLMKGDSHEQN